MRWFFEKGNYSSNSFANDYSVNYNPERLHRQEENHKTTQLEEVSAQLVEYKRREIHWKAEIELFCREWDGSNERGRNLPPGDDTQESVCGWAQVDYAMINDCLKMEMQHKKRVESWTRKTRSTNSIL